MALTNRSSFLIITVLGSILTGIVLYSQADTNSEIENKTEFNHRYHIETPPLPAQLDFAGEPVPLGDWNVRERLEKELMVNVYWQSSMMLMLKRTERYFSEIEPILKAEGIPDDFKYLAMAESGLSDAVSSSGARGVWQFMESTAQSYGLEVNSEVDERYQLDKATKAAAKYLKNSKNNLGGWTLAAAAFNRGLAGIKSDSKKQKVTSYYDLFLNTETSRYVFRILALKIISENPAKYGFHIEHDQYYRPVPSYAVTVDTTISDLADFAIQHGTTYRDVKLLNPWLRDDHLTLKTGQKYQFVMPEALAKSADE